MAPSPRRPINKLKIDRCFVQNIDRDDANRSILRATISMARALGLLTLAEGVETQGQFQTLLELGCDQFQGYLFGRPQPTESFEQTLADLAGGLEGGPTAHQLTPCSLGRGAVREVTANRRGMRLLL